LLFRFLVRCLRFCLFVSCSSFLLFWFSFLGVVVVRAVVLLLFGFLVSLSLVLVCVGGFVSGWSYCGSTGISRGACVVSDDRILDVQRRVRARELAALRQRQVESRVSAASARLWEWVAHFWLGGYRRGGWFRLRPYVPVLPRIFGLRFTFVTVPVVFVYTVICAAQWEKLEQTYPVEALTVGAPGHPLAADWWGFSWMVLALVLWVGFLVFTKGWDGHRARADQILVGHRIKVPGSVLCSREVIGAQHLVGLVDITLDDGRTIAMDAGREITVVVFR
jgi:hypothetical protein